MLTRLPVQMVALGVAAALVAACDRSPQSPTTPSAMPAAGSANTTAGSAAIASPAGAGHNQRVVTMMDACDPATFNAVLGDGACVRGGGVKFDDFLSQLSNHGSVGAWHFTPVQANMDVGDVLFAVNHGGETHTFTEVEEFGGGIVAELNARMHLTTVAPECSALEGDDFVPAGGTSEHETEEEAGVEKYQCCIHPWMRMEVHVGKH
jgi:plastocyanin